MITQNKHALNMPTKHIYIYTTVTTTKELKANEKLHYVGLQNTLGLRYIKHLIPKTKHTRIQHKHKH